MKNLDKNPLAWFVATILFGGLALETGSFEYYVVFVSAIILAKQIEILSK